MEQKLLKDKLGELMPYFKREYFEKTNYIPDAFYLPVATREKWACTCGMENDIHNQVCRECGINIRALISMLKKEHLLELKQSGMDTQKMMLPLEVSPDAPNRNNKGGKLKRRLVVSLVGIFIVVSIVAAIGVIKGKELFVSKKEVKDAAYTLEYNSISMDGKYRGMTENGIPVGEGVFVFGEKSDDKYFSYSGNWEDGKIHDRGTAIINSLEVNFPDCNGGSASYVGCFEGQVVNGVPEGEGTFEYEGNGSESYIYYKGEWEDDFFHGKGIERFPGNGEYGIYEGNFVNGSFSPTLAQMVQYLGSMENHSEYSLSDEQMEFISDNNVIFTEHEKKKVKKLVKKDFNLGEYKKSQESAPYLVKETGTHVIQIQEDKKFGKDITKLLLYSRDYDDVYSVYYFGKLKGVVEDSDVDLYYMPCGYSTYESVSGSQVWSVCAFGALVEKR